MRTVGEILRLSIQPVCKRTGRPRHEVEEWLAHILGLQRLDLYLQFDRPLEEEEMARMRPGIGRLASGEPLAYILGKTYFYGLEFEVSPSVLIPRPETESLVSIAKEYLSTKPSGTLVDVCSGSGCIGLTLKTLFPSWHVVLIDISKEALEVAQRNARRLHVDVEFLQGDLLEPFAGREADCIVSNPPYLSSSEWNVVDPSVATFEPRIALEAGPEGIEFYRRLFAQLDGALCPSGLCAVEIGASQGPSVLSLASSVGSPKVVTDLAGRDRVVEFCFVRTHDACNTARK